MARTADHTNYFKQVTYIKDGIEFQEINMVSNIAEITRCEDCDYHTTTQNGFLICKKSHNTSGGKWFCADGESNGQTDKTE